MSAGNNFVDLRISNAGISGSSEESVWPAFTDIMTVVLMIFLISLVAFLVRNAQLVDELQTTLIEKDQISERASLSAQENNSLQAQLALVRERIVSLESSLRSVTGVKDTLQKTLEQREQAVHDLETEIALLTKLRDQLNDSNSDLLSRLDLTKLTLTQTEADFASTRDTLAQKTRQLSLAESTLQDTDATLAETRDALTESAKKLQLSEQARALEKAEFEASSNTLNEKISLLLAAKAGLLVDKQNTEQSLSDAEAAKLDLNRKVLSLTEQLRMITDKLDSQTTRNETLDSQLEDQRVIMAGLSTSKQELEQKLLEMADNLAKLQALYESRGATVSELQAQLTNNTLRFKSLQEEYDSLDTQYRKLIRAARSPAGKYVVDVYFARKNGKPVYRLKLPDQETPAVLSLEALHARLAELAEKYKLQLYTKVRIDDKSGIGFNDAWVFTQSILSKYDYYANDISNDESNNESKNESSAESSDDTAALKSESSPDGTRSDAGVPDASSGQAADSGSEQ